MAFLLVASLSPSSVPAPLAEVGLSSDLIRAKNNRGSRRRTVGLELRRLSGLSQQAAGELPAPTHGGSNAVSK